MGTFEVVCTPALPAGEAFARVLDLDAHTALIPLTVVRGDVTAGFTARTGVGPVRVDDSMVVEEHAPPVATGPGVWRIRKTGRWIGGTIDLTVAPAGDGASIVCWHQHITVRGLSRVADPIVTAVARRAYRLVLRRLLRRG
ncbi:MAG: hypothetical protein Q4F67_11170 [Propionibacteriaceae bacterium]|nr:hypothetical protein [Propionibacteriaceae bacterium]